MRSQTERYTRLVSIYELLRKNVAAANTQLLSAVERVHERVKRATRRLKLAYLILRPLENSEPQVFNASHTSTQRSLVHATRSLSNAVQIGGMSADVPTIVGAGSGIGAAAGSWGAVQVIAHASTGTAMAGLHGAAAANAGWAWFGGGSLVTGGGGMAVGHFILPGIGTAVAVAVSATLSHREANRLGKLSDEIEGVNEQNMSAISKLNSNLNSTARLETKLRDEGQLLDDALKQARWKVRRFGWFSHCWRLLRLRIKGHYYTREEFACVARLDAAVERFMSAFKTV
jgi:hypothetical protein